MARLGRSHRASYSANLLSSVAALGLCAACLPDLEDFSRGDAATADGASTPDAAPDWDDALADADAHDGETSPPIRDLGGFSDADFADGQRPPQICQPVPLPCLDAANERVIEIPTEAGIEAFATANAGDTIQVRDRALGSLVWVPPLVTVRGCEGASITGTMAFRGTGGVVEGFQISGQVVANQTGTYVVRGNVFSGRTAAGAASIEGNSRDALVSADVELIVERNWFEGVPRAVGAGTSYHTMVHKVAIDVRNNVFNNVAEAIVISEGGSVGEIEASIVHNTFVGFSTAVRLFDVDRRTILDANLFASGTRAIASDSIYDGAHNMAADVEALHDRPPLSGAVAVIDAPFLSSADSNFQLRADSPAIDAVPAGSINDDYAGCARPVAFTDDGRQPRSDVGAFEAQPSGG